MKFRKGYLVLGWYNFEGCAPPEDERIYFTKEAAVKEMEKREKNKRNYSGDSFDVYEVQVPES